MKDPLVTTDLPLPRTDSIDVTVKTTVENISDQPQQGVVEGSIEDIDFQSAASNSLRTASSW